ncbi:MAG: hypothetical protein K6F89_06325 [Prevotella sp.]|nr:hypothetical protein [Prevotella sp.]
MLYISKILALSKGTYSSTQTYDILDFVQSGSAIYQSKKPNNTGHAVTDTEWWQLHYDLGEAIAAATSVNSPATQDASTINSILCIGTDGQPKSIAPLALVQYVIEELMTYDLIGRDKA